MRLIIEGKTNRDDVMVNTAKVTLPSGDVYTIDRDCTEYTISTVTGYLSMTWDMCYLHMINDISPFGRNTAYLSSDDGFQDILNEGTLELELEDDADPDYVVEVAEWSFCCRELNYGISIFYTFTDEVQG